jgi:uncharacterized secreted protein with C-terminal beta-propeller domain
MSRRPWLLAVPALLLLSGCTTSSAITPQTRPAMRLVAFDSCPQLLTELRAAARQSIGPYGLPGTESPALAGGARTMTAEKAAVPGVAFSDSNFSGTNVQEAGIDEPDMVKTDGRRIVTVSPAGVLSVVDPATRVRTGRLDLGISGSAQVLLSGEHALVLVDSSSYQAYKRQFRPAGARSEILLVDLSGPPRLISRYRTEGELIDARQDGETAHVVVSTSPNLKFPMRAESADGLLTENRKAIASAGLDAWLPAWEITTGTTTSQGRLGCGSVSRPASFSGTSMLSVLTFNLNAPSLTDGDPVGVVTDGNIVYGTATSLYVANDQRWRVNEISPVPMRPRIAAVPEASSYSTHPIPEQSMPAPLPASAPGTEIYRFALSGSAKPVFTASGTVPGQLLNQYSMSEWDGYLRVATTDGSVGASAVRVLQEKDGKLAPVSAVTGLGQGEQIYSVRFIGPRGYVVTFRQTDPLYSLDLTDPAHPRVTGALKITGYSSHLQPIDDSHLIGIGQEASTDGRIQGAQISLFDVADPADPRRLAQVQVQDGQSEAGFDPHALLWWPATRLLVIPMTDSASTGALAIRVTADGLQTIGRITPPPAADPVRRELVIGDALWTVSDTGLLASNLSTLDKTAWIPLT